MREVTYKFRKVAGIPWSSGIDPDTSGCSAFSCCLVVGFPVCSAYQLPVLLTGGNRSADSVGVNKLQF